MGGVTLPFPSPPLQHGTHGFPLGPSCMTYDPYRHVLFFGTNSGELKMFVLSVTSPCVASLSLSVCLSVISPFVYRVREREGGLHDSCTLLSVC